MKTLLGLIILMATLVTLGMWHESTLDPYEEGMHWSYSIKCENGFVYKILDKVEAQFKFSIAMELL